MNRKISDVGLKLIKSFEGCQLKAYKVGPFETYWTIGWGHYGQDVKEGSTITQAQADSMLINDMASYVGSVNNPSNVPFTAQLNQNQFDALVSFCYNLGAGGLKQLCKDRTIAQAAQHIPDFNKGGGVVMAGLVRRRQAELDLFNKKDELNGQQPSNQPKEDDKLELSKYQWDTLAAGVKSLLDRKVISDQTWLDKVSKKALTVSELSWLTFVVATK